MFYFGVCGFMSAFIILNPLPNVFVAANVAHTVCPSPPKHAQSPLSKSKGKIYYPASVLEIIFIFFFV